MRNYIFTILLCCFTSIPSLAQISGRIVDSQTGTALEGASILTNTGSLYTSNKDGYFAIPVVNDSIKTLLFSFVGYKPEYIKIQESKTVYILLKPDHQNILELVVSVTGFPASMLRSTGSVSTLTGTNLENHNKITLNDAINQIPGLNMSGGGYNTNRLTIRGIGSRNPYSSNRIRAYFDEIPLTSGDGTTSIEDIDMAAISRIEVLKGPSSAVFGSGLGGVMRIWSYQPENENFSTSINSEVGSFGTFRTFVKAAYKSGNATGSAVYSNSFSEGNRQNSRYERNSLLITADRNFDKTGFKLTLLYTGVEAQIPSSINLSSFNSDPTLAAPNWLAVKGFEKYKKLLSGFTAQTKLRKNITNKASAFASFSDPYESRPFNILDESSISGGFRENVQLITGDFEFMIGGEAFLESYKWKIFETENGQQGILNSSNREKRFHFNANTIVHYKPGEKLNCEAGLNFNSIKYSLTDLFMNDSTDLSGKYTYKSVLSPRLGVNYSIFPLMNLHFSGGHGFSAPSVEETLLPAGQINTSLKPESG